MGCIAGSHRKQRGQRCSMATEEYTRYAEPDEFTETMDVFCPYCSRMHWAITREFLEDKCVDGFRLVCIRCSGAFKVVWSPAKLSIEMEGTNAKGIRSYERRLRKERIDSFRIEGDGCEDLQRDQEENSGDGKAQG